MVLNELKEYNRKEMIPVKNPLHDASYAEAAQHVADALGLDKRPASAEVTQTLEAQIDDLATLQANWDGFGGLPLSKSVLDHARAVLPALLSVLPYPEVSANPNGTIAFEWASNQGFASLELGATRYSLVVLSPTNVPMLSHDGIFA